MEDNKFAPAGIYCAMCTPYQPSGAVDTDEIGRMVDFYIETGVNGVFPVGNIGEFISLDPEAKRTIIAAVTRRAGGRLKIIPGINDLDIKRSIELAEFCKEAGADGVVLSPPYYYPYSEEYIHRYIATVADRSPLPLVLYNSPSFVSPIEFENLISLCQHENIIAVKESSGDIKFLLKLLRRLAEENLDIRILMCWDELVLAGLTHGASGCIVASGGIVPEILVKLYHSFAAGDYRTALLCQKAVARITAKAMQLGFPHGYKLAALTRDFHFNIYSGALLQEQEEGLRRHLQPLREMIDEELRHTGCL